MPAETTLRERVLEKIRNSETRGPRDVARTLGDVSESDVKDTVMELLDRSILAVTADRKLVVRG